MKNVIKKIASIAMAFTLLGTGTAVTQTISPKSNYIITADAATLCTLVKNPKSLEMYIWYDYRYDYYQVTAKQGVDIRKSPSISAPIMEHRYQNSCIAVTGKELYRHKTYSKDAFHEGYYSNEIWAQASNGGWFPIRLDVYYKKPKNWHDYESQP